MGQKKLACRGTKHETHTKQEESNKNLASFTISLKALMIFWESQVRTYLDDSLRPTK